MRRGSTYTFAFGTCLAAIAVTPAGAADIGVSVNIGQPGFYGRIDIGNSPPPRVIYAQPVIIKPALVAVIQRPIYLHVPPGHARNWSKHCGRYNACGQRTYFVDEEWYRTVYVPAGRHHFHVAQHRDVPRHVEHGHGKGKDHGKGKGKGRSRD